MNKLLAILVASAALTFAASGAYAADSCTQDGYQMTAKHVIIPCGPHAGSVASFSAGAQTPSVSASGPSSPGLMVSGPTACRPGKFWIMTGPNSDSVMPCGG